MLPKSSGRYRRGGVREKLFSVVTQQPLFYNDTIYNNITLGCSNFDNKLLNNLIEDFGLLKDDPERKLTLDYVINDKGDNVSGGELQKISLIRCLLKKANVFIFDEPTSFLDVSSRDVFINKLNELKQSAITIIITHDDKLKDCCDVLIKFGQNEM